ncbi:mitochondrial ribosome-associated gtpase 1 [Limosa lapponica baueri]|uniref:Mitochondrial ribosome-associated GTPase 1 n=1 Tax=Limosa lapponica baueri TaxID=1758121 RepID=A0A2I0U9H3_LIMLA|nr:mitochondrial ribosome-associated gtpase 1 [Limosa lapponica baueri]
MRGWAGALRAAASGPGLGPGGFRERFDFGGRDVASWFPGHMAKGLPLSRSPTPLQLCTSPINSADPPAVFAFTPVRVILLSGTHIPLSGCNPMLQEALGIRPRVLVLNKMDLADPRRQPAVLEHLKQQGCSHVIFTDCQRDGNIKKIIPLLAKLLGDSPRYHRAESTDYSILVIGVPNVGKSSLINSLRRLHLKKGKATAVGGEPGVTKAVLTRIQVCEKPLMYLVDTPGVLPPKLGDVETGMKLALCGAIRDHLVGEDVMADYLLYTLNKQQQFGYVRHYGLARACNTIEPVLKCVALARGRTQKVKVLTGTGNVNVTTLDYPAAAYEFLRDFRAGRLGRVTLD